VKFLVTGGTGFIGASVARNLLARGISVVVGDVAPDPEVSASLDGAEFVDLDVGDATTIEAVFAEHRDVTHCIHLAYLMSAEVEANPPLGASVNVLGMTHMFEAAARYDLQRLVFTSSETVYGASQAAYGERPVVEDDFCAPASHFFTYGAMKILNEFMAEKYVAARGARIACTRPAVVFGHGRKRGAVLWAGEFASLPAVGKPVRLPFSSSARDTWIYKDDCAEQLVRLALAPRLEHFAYNNGGDCVSGAELTAAVRHWLPAAEIEFDEEMPRTPLIDWQSGERLAGELGFRPRPFLEGVRAHINEARLAAGLEPV
jgi:nucleoside-diphosphate-sugar epimerase